jgi:hypothetical protein
MSKDSKISKIKVNLNFDGVLANDVYLPEKFSDFQNLIRKEFSLPEKIIEINEFSIRRKKNETLEEIDEELYKKIIDNTEKLDEIYITEKSFNHNLLSQKAENFEEKMAKIIEEQLLIASRNIKTLILDGEMKEQQNEINNKVNRNVHEINCSKCNKQPITGFYYICNLEDNMTLCSKCAEEHEHPLFKIF